MTHPSSSHFSRRILKTPGSFIREMLNVTQQKEVISFAGGLPEPDLFPLQALQHSFQLALEREGPQALQYANSEGYLPLREWIAALYTKRGIPTTAQEILITSGSQQGLDLIGKSFVDPGAPILVERPSYLGALQAFSLVEPDFHEVEIGAHGPDLETLQREAKECRLFYTIPDFQNPTGNRYSLHSRMNIVGAMEGSGMLLVEDEPYRELWYDVESNDPPLAALYHGPSISLGSFSKVISPGLRIGYLRAEALLMKMILRAKQATDLHTSTLTQIALFHYLTQFSKEHETHLMGLRNCYRERRDAMESAIHEMLRHEARFTTPGGGMFLWLQLPGVSATELFPLALERGVALVPGISFYANFPREDAIRLNFTNTAPELIRRGVEKMVHAMESLRRSGYVYGSR